MLVCHYLDHESVEDEQLLNALAAEARRTAGIPRLVTCHRIERYSDENPPGLLGEQWSGSRTPLTPQTVVGDEAVLSRLVGIAAGLRSQIIGESAIERQVAAFVDLLSNTDPIKPFGRIALELARQLRQRFGLQAPSHGLLALRDFRRRSPCDCLMAVGAGMVGQEVVEQYRSLGYGRLLVISRDPKRARRRLGSGFDRSMVRSLARVLEDPPRTDFDLIVATSDVPESYRLQAQELARSAHCRGIVDVSAEPIVTDGAKVVTLTNAPMKALIAEHNAHWLECQVAALQQIPKLVAERLRTIDPRRQSPPSRPPL
ncbi:MAG: hypothetical protein U0792_24020 [Gemmataceae bacterium]